MTDDGGAAGRQVVLSANPRSVAFALGALAIIGSFGPWARVDALITTVTINGTDGGRDGWVSLVLAGLALAAAAVRRFRVFGVLGLLVAATGLYDLVTLGSGVSPAWGLILVFVSGLGMIGVSWWAE
jgi:hypothetical protein